MVRGIIYWLSLVSALSAQAQTNLIPNPGFEDHVICPGHLSEFNGVVSQWFTPSTGTPNYYHACATSPEVGVPLNYFGHKIAFKGSAYVGIMTSNAFREYISVPLLSPLSPGVTYRLSFNTSIILQNRCKSNGLDILFSTYAPFNDVSGANLIATPTLTANIDYRDEKWQYSSFCFTAQGGEKYLTIGDFSSPQAHHNCLDGDISYYFIDEVSLEKIQAGSPIQVNYPICDISFPFSLDGADILGTSEPVDKYSWLWDGIFDHQSRLIEKSGSYKLVVNKPNCVMNEYVIQIDEPDCGYSVFVPNIFTPNDDGFNDVFTIHSNGIVFDKISIFNRIGQVVYESSDPDFKWDGRIKGDVLSDGVYVYLLKVQIRSSGKNIQKSGAVTLIR